MWEILYKDMIRLRKWFLKEGLMRIKIWININGVEGIMVVKIVYFSILNVFSFYLFFFGMLEICIWFCEYLLLFCEEYVVFLLGL